MSPSSRTASYTPVPILGGRDFTGVEGKDMMLMEGKEAGFPFGNRKQEHPTRGSPLKVSKDSQRIRKPPLPLPQVQYRPPVIIHTYSPKVLHTEPDDFMSLVQKLTGSSDTRLRLKKVKPAAKSGKKLDKADSSSPRKASIPESSASASIQRQGSGTSSATSNCGSPTSSEDSATFAVTDPGTRSASGELATVVKQSNSPRSPFDADFEFDNNDNLSMFTHFDGASSAGTVFVSQVKAEPPFAFTENMSYASSFTSSFADFLHAPANSKLPGNMVTPKLSRPQMHTQEGMGAYNIDASAGYLSSHLLAGLPDLLPAWSAQSNYLDSITAGAGASGHFIHQAPYLRQRQFNAYSPAVPEGTTLVALENLHGFSMT